MQFENNNILKLIYSELRYNWLILLMPATLLFTVFIINILSNTFFWVSETGNFTSPALLIGVSVGATWFNRLKENRDFKLTIMPVSKLELLLARYITYIGVLTFLFLFYLLLNLMSDHLSENLLSNISREFLIVLFFLGLSFIVQDLRYCISGKYSKYWMIITLLILSVLLTPIIIVFTYTLLEMRQTFINNYFLLVNGITLLLLSVYINNKRKFYID